MRLKTHQVPKGVNIRSQKPGVGIMTHATFEKSGNTPMNNLIALVNPLASKLFIITGDYSNSTPGVEIIRINAKRRRSVPARILEQAVTHIRVMWILARLRNEIDILILISFGTPFPIPILFAQLLGMRCFIILAALGSAQEALALKKSGAQKQRGELTRLYMQEALERVSYYLADKLIVYSPSMINQVRLERYNSKILVTHRHFVNLDEFRFKNDIERRDNVIGYVGRFEQGKGILNLIKAIPNVLSERNDVSFLIIGDGRLEDEIHACLDRYALRGNVKLIGWVPHHELPDYLTRLKLLVLPSYNEGLPNVMLEAMACGTPVLATRVASIPDVIKDGETGFLLQDNSPKCIAEMIRKSLMQPQLRRITANARILVESEFQYEKLSKTWGDIIVNA